jgi:hypothetical protein
VSEYVKALELALHKGPSRVAMCPRCPDSVLVSTLRFVAAEFYCLDCEGHFSFVAPRPAEETPELLARIEEAKRLFGERFPRVPADA